MTIGSQLREARTVRNLTYADVSKVTKIQPWILQALEEDRANESISPVYAKGFLSNYTRFLGLDLAEMAKRSVVPAAPAPAPSPARTRAVPSRTSQGWPTRSRMFVSSLAPQCFPFG